MLVLLASLAIAVTLAPVVRIMLLKRGLMDIPNTRSSHRVPVPRGGGVACLGGVAGGLALAEVTGHAVPWIAVAAALMLAGVGFADDRAGLAPTLRLGAQVVGGGIIGLGAGGTGWILLGAVLTPVLVNAVNFMDGINGITSLNIAAWGGVAMAVGSASEALALFAVGAAAAGASLGFLPWNAPKARLFLGDVGSYLFGALASVGVVLAGSSGPGVLLVAAPFTIYLADTGYALLRRAARGESLMTAHREHVYQRLVDDARLSHMLVATVTVLLSLAITAAWIPRSVPLGGAATLVVVAGYLASPALVRRARVRATGAPGSVG